MEQDYANQQTREIESVKAAAYAAVSAIFSFLGLGGLLIGYYYAGGSPAGRLIAGGAPILKSSLLGVVLEVIRGSISAPEITAAAGIAGYLPFFMYIVVIVLIGALLLSCIMTIAAIFLPGFSRGLCYRNGEMLFFCYGALFSGNLLFRIFTNAETGYFDLSSLIAAAAILAVLFLTSLAEHRAKTAANLILLILSALCVCALVLPNTPLCAAVNALTFATRNYLTRYALAALCAIVLVNFVISVLRIRARRGYPFGIVRFCILLLSAVAFVAAYYVEGKEFFPEQPLAAMLLFLGIFGGLVFSAFFSVRFGKKQKAKRPVRETAPDLEEETQPTA